MSHKNGSIHFLGKKMVVSDSLSLLFIHFTLVFVWFGFGDDGHACAAVILARRPVSIRERHLLPANVTTIGNWTEPVHVNHVHGALAHVKSNCSPSLRPQTTRSPPLLPPPSLLCPAPFYLPISHILGRERETEEAVLYTFLGKNREEEKARREGARRRTRRDEGDHQHPHRPGRDPGR